MGGAAGKEGRGIPQLTQLPSVPPSRHPHSTQIISYLQFDFSGQSPSCLKQTTDYRPQTTGDRREKTIDHRPQTLKGMEWVFAKIADSNYPPGINILPQEGIQS
jgi:hypothetical protein